LVPGAVVVPLIFNARRYFEGPKTCAILFAIALAVFGLLITVATMYSGIALGIYSTDTAKDIPFIAAFGCTIMAATAYHLVLRRLTAKQPPSTPSMRRPVDVKARFFFLLSFRLFPFS
jgi:hypothetical protein